MGTFDSSRCVNRDGTRRATTDIDIVDKYGTIRGAAQFDAFNVVDLFGNIGQLTPTGPWEMQLGTVETVGAHQGTISNNYINAGNLTNFTSTNCIGYMAGNIGGSGTFNVKNGPQTIGGVSYPGNGLTIFSGTNTCTGILNMETGTNIQLGLDCTNAVTKWAGNLTIGTGATCTQYNGWSANTYLCQALTNTGTYNVTGCGTCGVGGVGLATTVANNGTINIDKCAWRNQSTWSGTGTVNVKAGGTFQLTTNAMPSTATVNINGDGWCDAANKKLGAIHASGTGATFAMKVNVETAATISNAVNVNNTFSGLLTGSAPLTVNSQSATKPNGIIHFSNTANPYNGTMSVDGTNLSASYGTSLQYAKIVLTNGGRIGSNASQTVGSLASADPTTYWSSADFLNQFIKNNGVTTFAGRLLWNGGSNTANWWLEGPATNQLTMTGTGNTGNIYPRNGAKLVLQGGTFTGTNGQVRASNGSTVSAGTSTTGGAVLIYIDALSGLDVRASGAGTGIINTGPGTSLLNAGWKVNLLDPLNAGTYVIWKNTGAAITQLPTIGTNLSGRTVTGFAWNNAVSPKTLSVTLA